MYVAGATTHAATVTFANNTLNAMGDDCYIGDQNSSGAICIKGINGNTNIRFIEKDGTAAGTLTWDGSAFTISHQLTTSGGLVSPWIELISATPFIDFHFGSSTADYTSRIIESSSGYLQISGKLGIGGSSTDYKLYVNGNTLNNGIEYFANGTTYYINNSGTANLYGLTVNSTATFKSTVRINNAKDSGVYYIRGNVHTKDWGYIGFVRDNPGEGDLYYTTRWRALYYSYNSSSKARLDTYEYFDLPVVDKDRESSAGYSILTTKYTVTTAQGGTGNTSYTASRLLYTSSATKISSSAIISDGNYITAPGTIHANGGYLKSTLNGNTVTIGSQNTSFCHITNSADIPFWFNKTIQIDGNVVLYTQNTSLEPGYLHLGGATNATMTSASTNPRICFTEGASTQPVYLVYTDYDSYRSPAGLKVIGGASAAPAWFEVEGSLYLGAPTATGTGIYWNPYVESTTDASDAGSIYQIKAGVAGGTELRISQLNDATDCINICTNAYIYLNSKKAFTINDGWLRINDGGGFSSGIYCGSSVLRTDGELWSDAVRIINDWVGFYNSVQGSTRYGYIQCNVDRMYFRKENSTANLSYYFDFNANVYTSAHFIGTCTASSWIGGQRDNNAGFNLTDATNTGSYWPWIRQTNTGSGRWFSLGNLNNQMYIMSSATSRTDNAYDRSWVWYGNDGHMVLEGGTYHQMIQMNTSHSECSIAYNGNSGNTNWVVGRTNSRFGWWNGSYWVMTLEPVGRLWVGRDANDGERQIGVSHSTSGTLYMWANNGEKGIYSGTGQSTGYVIQINSSGKFFRGKADSAGTADKLGTNAGGASNPVYFTGGKPTACSYPKSGAWFAGVPSVGSDGVMEIGRYIDFHSSNASTADFGYRLQCDADGRISGSGTLALINNTQDNGYNALLYLEHQSSNDWAIRINKSGADYGITIDTANDATYAITTPGGIRAHAFWACNGSNGERNIGVDSSTTGMLYLYANTSTKGLYSGSGYRTGSVIYIDSSNTIFYGNRWRTPNLELAEVDANCMGLCTYGQSTAKRLNVGALLISSAWADSSNVPTNGLYCKGAAVFNGNVTVSKNNANGGGIILSDDGDIVDLNDGYCAMRFSYGVRIHEGNRSGNPTIALRSSGTVKAINWYTNDDTVSFRCHSANEFSWSCNQTTMWFNYRTYATQISTFYFGNGTSGGLGTVRAGAVYGAVWNDYAEYREGTITEPGRVVATTQFSNKVSPTTQRLQPAAHVISDTAGYATGESDTAKTPLGVAGRVLVYPYRNINEYKVGDALCAAPGGTADIMTRDEIMIYPDRIIGIVDEIPTYEYWHQTLSCAKDEDKNKNGSTIAHVKVKGRIWMYIK